MKFVLYHELIGQYEIQHAPKGWDTLKEKYTRHPDYHGIAVDFTAELTFVQDGFDMLNELYNAFGIDADVKIFVYEPHPRGFTWVKAYEGTVAMDDWNSYDTGEGTANIDGVGWVVSFLNSSDTKVNLASLVGVHGHALKPFEQEQVTVSLHSQAIAQRYEATAPQRTYGMSAPVTNVDGLGRSRHFYLGFDSVTANELNVNQYTTGFTATDTKLELFTSTVTGEFTLHIKLQGYLKMDRYSGARFDKGMIKLMVQKNEDEPILLQYNQQNDVDGHYKAILSIEKSMRFGLVPGDKVYVYGICDAYDLPNVSFGYVYNYEAAVYTGSFLKLSATTRTSNTSSKGYLPHEAFSRIISSYTGRDKAFYSDFFGRTDSHPRQYTKDGPGALLMLLNGFAIRNFPQEGTDKRNVYMSFKDLFTNMDAIHCLGAGTETVNGELVFRVEERKYFYKSEVGLKLGVVSKLKKYADLKRFCNTASFGYSNWQVEEQGGLQEFNARTDYTLPIVRGTGKYDKVCTWVAGGFKIEKVRRQQYTEAETKDSRDDETVYMVQLMRSNGKLVTERNQNIAESANAANISSLYNVRISPARMRKAHEQELSAMLIHKQALKILFNKGEANYKFKSRFHSEASIVEESADVAVNMLAAPYHTSEIYEFECPFNRQMSWILKQNPYYKIEFKDAAGNKKYGWVLECETELNKKSAKFKVLRAY